MSSAVCRRFHELFKSAKTTAAAAAATITTTTLRNQPPKSTTSTTSLYDLFKSAKTTTTSRNKSPKPTTRLHDLFKSAKTTTALHKKTPKPTTKTTNSTVAVSSLLLESSQISEEKYLRELVVKSKKLIESNKEGRRYHKDDEKTVRRLASAGKFKYIEEIIEHQKKHEDITSEGFNVHLISLYGRAGMFEAARKLFDEMPHHNCKRTLVSFNALLSAAVKSKKYDQVKDFFRELPEKLSMKPDTCSYNTLVKAYCDMGSFDLAFSLIGEMEENGLEPNTVTFNTLLGSLHRDGKNLVDVEKVWKMMEDKNVVPNAKAYNPNLRALVEDNRVSEAVQMFEEMCSKDVKPNIFTFNSLIEGFRKEGNLEQAKRFYKEITQVGCSPNYVTFELLLHLACDKSDFDFGWKICKEAITCRCNVKKSMIQLVVNGLIKESKTDEANELVQLSKSYNFNSDKKICFQSSNTKGFSGMVT